MRLLLRASSHQRTGAGETQIAASPDTARREAWQWDLSLVDGSRPTPPPDSVELVRSDGSVSRLALNVDPNAVAPELRMLDLAVPASIERAPDELMAFVVGSGVALVEGRHVLRELDAMVLAGDDPVTVRIEQLSDETVSMALVRLSPCGAGSVAWVP